MSFSNRIPGKFVKKSETSISLNDKHATDSKKYEKSIVQQRIDESLKTVREQESEMLEEVRAKREELIQKAYQEGKDLAYQEAEKKVKSEYQEMIEEANLIYGKANDYYMGLIEDTENIREEMIQKVKDEIIDVILVSVKKIIKQDINLNMEMINEIFDEALKNIKYENKGIYVRVNPETKQYIEDLRKENVNEKIEFLPDIRLEREDFIIETEREIIDVSIEAQLEELKKEIRSIVYD